jgi:MFS family permease
METKELKLNYKNTLFIGCAFFSILMIWQVYNHYAPLFLGELLKNTLENEKERLYIIGIIMAADNFFALFMLPIFGSLSDRTKTPIGKRMPYIVAGMFLASVLFPLIAVMFIRDSLVGVIVMMGVILIIMNVYRSPAVALMPDLTPKPLRSKANGIINLTGYLGAILAGGMAMFIKIDNALVAFIIASVLMLIAMILLFFNINENKLLKENEEAIKLGEELSQSLDKIEEDKPLSKSDKRNFIILILSVFLWFVSFNAVETFISTYCKEILQDERFGGLVVIVMTISSILTFIPSGFLANRIGRKRSVIIGLVSIIVGFILAIIASKLIIKSGLITTNSLLMVLAIALCGIGWALVNVNSYPMLVELSSRNTIGKYTGYYYTSSMVAQTVTPILIGFIMFFRKEGLNLLFYYSLVMMIIALTVFVLFKENKKVVRQIQKGLEAFDVD